MSGRVGRLGAGDVACWVLKTSRPPSDLLPGWVPGTERSLIRCVRSSYRLELMAAGQPCLLWLSGRNRAGVHALGVLTAATGAGDDGGPVIPVRLTLLGHPVPRADLLADPRLQEAEVLRMPAGSNPSWLSGPQFDAVLDRVTGSAWNHGRREPEPPSLGLDRLAADPAVLPRGDACPVPLRGRLLPNR
jgi:hypothetical protein